MATPTFKLPVTDPVPPTNPPVELPSFTELIIGTDKFNVNANGEAVDPSGKVIKTKEELENLKKGTSTPPIETPEEKAAKEALIAKTAEIDAQLIEGAEIELDGVKHKLDKDGNIVVDGKVIKTKAELKTLLLETTNEPDEVNYISEIQKATNLTLTDDKGNPITYENTVPGLVQHTQDVFKEGKKLGAEEYASSLFEKFPILQNVIEHLSINGNLKDFIEEIDYSKIILSDDEAQHIDIFTRAKKAQGVPDNEIQDLIKYYKEDKKLKTAAETGLTFLKTKQTASATERALRLQEAQVAQEAERTNYWNDVNKILTSKQIVVNDKKFNIPDVIKVKDAEGKIITRSIKDFQDYIQKPLNFNIDGKIYTMTQLEYDDIVENQTRTPHHDLFDAYRKFTKYDDSQLISANVSDNTVKKIIKLTTKASGGGSDTPKGGVKLVLPIK